MKFAALATFAAALIVPCTVAQLNPTQIADAIADIAKLSQNTNNALSGLSTKTLGPQVVKIGHALVDNFKEIVKTTTKAVSAIEATPPFLGFDFAVDAVDSDEASPGEIIVMAFSNFVAVHQALLETVIGESTPFAQFRLTAPIAAILRSLEGIVDSLAYGLISLIPTREISERRDISALQAFQDSIMSGKEKLDIAFANSITKYSEKCTPSLFYPISLPTCKPA